MKNVIYKYAMNPGPFAVELPADAEILSAHAQGEGACIWVKLDPDAPKVTRRFLALPTGNAFETTDNVRLAFIATVLVAGGALVWHVFEIRENQA